jgi:hypothetical protein
MSGHYHSSGVAPPVLEPWPIRSAASDSLLPRHGSQQDSQGSEQSRRSRTQIITNIQYLARSIQPIYPYNSTHDQIKTRDSLEAGPALGSSEFFSGPRFAVADRRSSSSETKATNHESSFKFKTGALGGRRRCGGNIGNRFFIDGLDPWQHGRAHGRGSGRERGRQRAGSDLRREIPTASKLGGKAHRIQEGCFLGSARSYREGRLGNNSWS